jgi:hypothetical protein
VCVRVSALARERVRACVRACAHLRVRACVHARACARVRLKFHSACIRAIARLVLQTVSHFRLKHTFSDLNCILAGFSDLAANYLI